MYDSKKLVKNIVCWSLIQEYKYLTTQSHNVRIDFVNDKMQPHYLEQSVLWTSQIKSLASCSYNNNLKSANLDSESSPVKKGRK